jgi:hypothetical protein
MLVELCASWTRPRRPAVTKSPDRLLGLVCDVVAVSAALRRCDQSDGTKSSGSTRVGASSRLHRSRSNPPIDALRADAARTRPGRDDLARRSAGPVGLDDHDHGFEIRTGIEFLEQGRRRRQLEHAFAKLLAEDLGGRVQSFDQTAALAGRTSRRPGSGLADLWRSAMYRSPASPPPEGQPLPHGTPVTSPTWATSWSVYGQRSPNIPLWRCQQR